MHFTSIVIVQNRHPVGPSTWN